MNSLPNIPPHLWVIFAFAALSFVQWMYRKSMEQRQANQRKREAARRQEELLRTGRIANAPPSPQRTLTPGAAPPARPAPNPAASTREQQLRELRRQALEAQRRKAQAQQSGRAGAGGAIADRPRIEPQNPTPTPMRTAPKLPSTARKPQIRPAPPRAGQDPGRLERSVPENRASGLARTPRPADASSILPPTAAKPRLDHSLVHTAEASPAREEAAPQAAASQGFLLADIRRAFILSEVLAPPIALRRQGMPTGLS